MYEKTDGDRLIPSGGDDDRLVLTVAEAAQILRLSVGSVYAACRRNELPNLRVGRRILVPRAALIDLARSGTPRPNED